MNNRRNETAEEDAPRSYCVFERDRILPRPTPRSPLMTDASTPQRTSVKTPIGTRIAFALWGVTLLWWFIYYANWGGAFGLMGLKLMCITGATPECLFFQQQIAKLSAVPTYSPIFWWAGCVAAVIGFVQSRASKRERS